MAKTRTQKEAELQLINQLVDGKAVVFTRYSGLTVRDIEDLRSKLRENGSGYRVVKTSLLKKVLEEKKITVPEETYSIQLGLASNLEDEVEPNKAVVEFTKNHEAMGILGAIINGEYVSEAQVRSLAALPGRDELYAKVVGSLNAPISGLVNVLSGNLRGLVSVIKQYQESKS